ncbi:unnamed protein product [Urochloa humidicola]
MDLVTGALGNLPSKLLELLHNEYRLQKGVRTQVQSLSRELESMYAALRKVAETPWDQLDEQVKVWAREVREASYDMEDVIDSFLVRVDGCCEPVHESRLKEAMKKMGDLFLKGKARHEISGAIQLSKTSRSNSWSWPNAAPDTKLMRSYPMQSPRHQLLIRDSRLCIMKWRSSLASTNQGRR